MVLDSEPGKDGFLLISVHGILCRVWKTLLVPVDARLHALLPQTFDQVRADNILPELFLLQQLKILQGRPRVGEILEVRRPAPVLEIVEVGDKGWIAEELPGSQMVQVQRVAECLNELRILLTMMYVRSGELIKHTSSSSSKRVYPPYLGSSAPDPGAAGGSLAELFTDMGSDAIVQEVVSGPS